MFISSRQNRQLVHSYQEIPYHVSVINSCLSGKLLSVTVSNSLSWNYHIGTVITKCNTLSRIKLYLSTENRKRFYNEYILPHFDLLLFYMGKLHTLPGGKTSKTSEKGCPSIFLL